MKRIGKFAFITILTMIVLSNTVNSVDYSMFDTTYSLADDYQHYVNTYEDTNGNGFIFEDEINDDGLQLRANCYGYAMRLYFNDVYDQDELPYAQVPGEFWDKSDSNMTFDDLIDYYYNDGNNDGKMFEWQTVLRFISYDCATLGYELSIIGVYDANVSFQPPSASAQSGKRLIALVGREDGSSVHFYMQNSDDSWSHKNASEAATKKCVECNVNLTNSNISSHVHCYVSDTNAAAYYDGTVCLLRIDAPGSSDRFHRYGSYNSYYTQVSSGLIPGDYINSALPVEDITAETVRGSINYIDDIDFYVFDVPESGNYTITFGKHTYAYRVYFGEVNDNLMISSTTAHGVAASLTSTTFTKNLQAGKRYYVKIIAYGQTLFDSALSYSLSIS